MLDRLRELFLALAVLGLVTTAAVQPSLRILSLVFAVVGVGLLLRRRQRRLLRNEKQKGDGTGAGE